MIVASTPPKLKMRIGASPPSNVVPTTSPTFLAYRRRGPEHWGQRNPGPCSSKYIPAHSACRAVNELSQNRETFEQSESIMARDKRRDLGLWLAALKQQQLSQDKHLTYPIVNVSTVLAYPITLPIFGSLLLLLLRFRLLVTVHHVQLRIPGGRNNRRNGGWACNEGAGTCEWITAADAEYET